ncbi:MAG TPA: DUF1801 domain-containing protein [Candidatus Binatia bacterium]|jgi:uncharacterized protein YdhG (YjbR/CyaY superfamily)|nr:DUF1801 domain-containing protein [Candidatus Binatia bacterium]
MKMQFETIEKYIRASPKDVRGILRKIRQTIRRAAPQAVEVISYRMPAFKLNGKILVYFASFKNHIGLYPPAPKALKKRASQYAGPKGNLKFPIDKPIPLDLVKTIVKLRIKEKKMGRTG